MEPSVIKYLSQEYQSMCELRDNELRKPIGQRLSEEEKQKDASDILFGYIIDGNVIGCCILTKIDEATGKLRQMAVSKSYQGQGIGRKVLQFAEQYAKRSGFETLTMHARKVALEFYIKEGYTLCSEEFTEVGIPHYLMKKHINHNP